MPLGLFLSGIVAMFSLFVPGPRQYAVVIFAPFLIVNGRQVYLLATVKEGSKPEFTTTMHVAFAVACLLFTVVHDTEQLNDHVELCLPLAPMFCVISVVAGFNVGFSSKMPHAARVRCGTRALMAVTIRAFDNALIFVRTEDMRVMTVLLFWTLAPYVLGLLLPLFTEKLCRCGEIANALEQQEKKIAELRDDLNAARVEIDQCDEHAEQLMQQSRWYHRQLQGLMRTLGRGSSAHGSHEVA